MKIRTRFAPSPTGYLHIGGLRTALFAFLAAKSQGGECILRIEDTDQARLVRDSADSLTEILEWVGLEFDESPEKGGDYGPYIQSERQKIYEKYKNILLDKGQAYHCFCSQERLEEMRKKQQAEKLPPRYDRKCRGLSRKEAEEKIQKGQPFVIRQKMPLDGQVEVFDELRGAIKIQAKELDDHVLIKSNGVPTYHFASVVDDHLMGISHVTRAEEWLPSFPKNALLYRSFGWDLPQFIHLPVVLNKSGGGKLSKRQGDVSVEDFRAKGYLPEALVNFCALLGWSPYTKENQGKSQDGKNLEVLSLKEIVKRFDFHNISASPAIFDTEKLDYLNACYIRNTKPDKLLELARPFLAKNMQLSASKQKQGDVFVLRSAVLEQERIKKLSDLEEATKFLFKDELDYDKSMLVWKKMEPGLVKPRLKELLELINGIDAEDFTQENLEKKIVGHINERSGKTGEYLWPLRVALSGQKNSPGPFEIAWVLGKPESIKRLKQAIAKFC